MADRVAVMRAGGIEQVGPPAEVYDRPASSYVATFLGGANLIFPGGDIHIPPAIERQVEPGELIAVKPETIRITAATGEGTGTLLEREYLGFMTALVVRVGSTTLHATAPSGDVPRNLQPGDAVGIAIDWTRAVVCSESPER
jgi:putative spermidine/putrescine transport system ATP-binding protein